MATVRSPSVPLLTVRDIAKRIRRDDEDLEVVVARLRNWTKEGLLQFSGDKHPGTGRARLYPEGAVIDALVLGGLTAIGIPAVRAGSATPYTTVFGFGRQAYYQEFPNREASRETIFLVVFGAEGSVYDGANPHRAALTYALNGLVNFRIRDDQGDATILLNLTNLFRRLKKRMGED
jgi:hypothetical protein